jgi:hypothetical protein
MESYAAIKVLLAGDASVPIHTLVNLSAEMEVAADVQSRIAAACRRFLGVRATPTGNVPPCETAASNGAALVCPVRSESARAIDRVADTLWAQLQLDRQSRTESRDRASRSA